MTKRRASTALMPNGAIARKFFPESSPSIWDISVASDRQDSIFACCGGPSRWSSVPPAQPVVENSKQLVQYIAAEAEALSAWQNFRGPGPPLIRIGGGDRDR